MITISIITLCVVGAVYCLFRKTGGCGYEVTHRPKSLGAIKSAGDIPGPEWKPNLCCVCHGEERCNMSSKRSGQEGRSVEYCPYFT